MSAIWNVCDLDHIPIEEQVCEQSNSHRSHNKQCVTPPSQSPRLDRIVFAELEGVEYLLRGRPDHLVAMHLEPLRKQAVY